ncbi:MFS transporter [Rhizocola hellebori]|uniref:MFS transporter n=1 Tax=Rhizocola hellebori TaxID=1392758 RepID=A0A8J3Q8I2_9ACTN|nr:MFS transporter [Rhizocola hellebori]GIH05045.1 MFS transporter [Rhizocola hellebori]
MIWKSLRELPVWMRFFTLGRLIKSTGSLAWLYMAVYLVQERGLEPAMAGFIVGANGVGIIAGSLSGGWVGDRFGIRRTIIVSNIGSAIGAVLVPLVPVGALGFVTATSGFVGAMGFPLGMALVAGSIPPAQRRTGVALSRAAMNAGVVLGPPLGALAASYDFRIVFLMESVAGLAMAFVIWRFVPRPAAPSTLNPGGSSLWRAVAADRTIWMLLLAVLLVDAAYRQIFTALPLMLTDTGTRLIGYSALISLSSVLIVIAETPLAVKLANRPALKIIPIGYLFIGLGFVALVFSPTYAGAALCIGLITLGEMLYKPTSAAYAADRAPDGMQGRYQSLYSSASIGGMVIAPPLGGYVYQHAPGLLWPICASLALLGAAAFFLLTQPRVVIAADTETLA